MKNMYSKSKTLTSFTYFLPEFILESKNVRQRIATQLSKTQYIAPNKPRLLARSDPSSAVVASGASHVVNVARRYETGSATWSLLKSSLLSCYRHHY